MNEIMKVIKGMGIFAGVVIIVVVLGRGLIWLDSVNHHIAIGLIIAVLWVLIGMVVRVLWID